MLLYICRKCGKWQDRALTDAVTKALNSFSQALTGKPLETPTGMLCPDGHGAMRLVEAGEKLFVREEKAEKSMHTGRLDSRWGPNVMATVAVHRDRVLAPDSVHIDGGHGDYECASIRLDPAQALSLLAWLEQERTTLEQMVRDTEKAEL